nr:MAG TPA: hypothetical protein [Caudoviricetes sp.]
MTNFRYSYNIRIRCFQPHCSYRNYKVIPAISRILIYIFLYSGSMFI